MDGFKKAITLVLTIAGIIIFYSVISAKIDLMAREAEAKIEKLSSEVSWYGFLHEKAAMTILENQEHIKSE